MKNIHWLVPYKVSTLEAVSRMNLASARMRAGLFYLPAFKRYSVDLNELISDIESIDVLCVGKFPSNRQDLYKIWINYINEYNLSYITPIEYGGQVHIDNLCLICPTCNNLY